MAVTESWLCDHLDAEVNIEGYSIFRGDRKRRSNRNGRHSGGVALYILNDFAIDAEPVLRFSNGVVETLAVYIPSRNMYICVMYRQPDDEKGGFRSTKYEFKQGINSLQKSINKLPQPLPNIVVCGDLNMPWIDWNNGLLVDESSKSEESCMNRVLHDFIGESYLTQYVDCPTHEKGNTLDLIFTNNSELIHGFNAYPTINSDHHIVECTTNLEFCYNNTIQNANSDTCKEDNFSDYNFFSDDINWSSVEEELYKVDWDHKFKDSNVTDKFAVFSESCLDVVKKLIPKRKLKNKNSLHNIPKERRCLMQRRCRVEKRMLSGSSRRKNNKFFSELAEIEKQLQKSYHDERENQEHKAVAAIKVNSKYFYSYAKKFSKTKSQVGPFLKFATKEQDDWVYVEKVFISDPLELSEMLSSQYSSVYSSPSDNIENIESLFEEDSKSKNESHFGIYDIDFDEHDIMQAISELSTNSSAGPDRFPAMFLLKCKKSLSAPLCQLWRESLDISLIPKNMKNAHITPIHKGGRRDIPKNYRPIALTSILIKVFEKVIRNSLVQYLESHGMMNNQQHGFRKGRSCISQLLAHYDNIIKLLEEGKDVDTIYLDFSKAFDKVDFAIVLRKLHKLGIRGKLGRWIIQFLKERTQSVVVNGVKSTLAAVLSGVPQGSVLGPLLFLILISDIDENVTRSYVSSFADDTRITTGIQDMSDANLMQENLKHVYNWAKLNNMLFNSDKFECIKYSVKNLPANDYSYSDDRGQSIECKSAVKDLGIIMSNDCSFKKHIEKTAKKGSSQAGWVLRTFQTRNQTPMLTLFKSMVIPHLEYCCQLWNPCDVGSIQLLESVQRNFVRRINGVQHLSYWDQLKHLGLYSLQRRRERYIIFYAWKMMEKLVPNVGGLHGIWNARRGRLCHADHVMKSKSQRINNIRFNSFTVHALRLFNTMPMHIRNTTGCSIETFKSGLDKHLRNILYEPLVPAYTILCKADSNSLLDMHRLCRYITNSQDVSAWDRPFTIPVYKNVCFKLKMSSKCLHLVLSL